MTGLWKRFVLLGMVSLVTCAVACATGTPSETTDATTASVGGSGGVGGVGGSGGEGLCAQDCSTVDTPDCRIAVCNDGTYEGDVGTCIVVDDDGAACDDGLFCTVGDSCLGGTCSAATPNDCGMTTGACNEVVCNEDTDSCSTTPVDEGQTCTAANMCLIGATCTNGLCGGGTLETCLFAPTPDDCHVMECNPSNGDCEPVIGNEGLACIDTNDLCTSGKLCAAGVCGGGAPTDCSHLTMDCDVGACDATNGNCITQTAMNGGLCDDLDACTAGEVCTAGTCGGGALVTGCSMVADGCCPAACTAVNDVDCACMTTAFTTDLSTTNGWDGVMFDIVATTAIEVLNLDVNLDAGMKTVEIYYKAGTHDGFENNAAAWTLAGSASVNPVAANVATVVPIAVNLTIAQGQTYGFYVTTTNNGTLSNGLNYVDNGITTNQVWLSDANIQVLGGKGQGYPFTGSSFIDRAFSGIIHYEKCGN